MADESSPADPARAAADLQKAQAEAQKAVAEARKALIEARREEAGGTSPPATTKPLEGTVTAGEGFGFLSGVVAHEAAAEAAAFVATQIKGVLAGTHAPKVLLATETERASGDLVLLQVEAQLTRMLSELEARIQANARVAAGPEVAEELRIAGIPAVLAGAASLVGLTADLVGFFRSNYTVTGRTESVADLEVRASVAGVLAGDGVEVHVEGMSPITRSSVTERFTEVIGKATELRRSTGALEESIAEDEPDGSPKRLAVAESVAVMDACAALAKDLTTAPQHGSAPLMTAAARRALLDGSFTHVAHVVVAGAGGEAITKQSRWGSGSTAFLGAGVVTYVVQNAAGRVLRGGTRTIVGLMRHDPDDSKPDPIVFSKA